MHRPAAVAEVALDLADDRRHGVRLERDAAVEVEAVDRLDQPDRADLHQVVERLALAGVAACDRPHERQVLLDQLVARTLVAFLVIRAQQLELGSIDGHCHLDPLGSRCSSRSQISSSRSTIAVLVDELVEQVRERQGGRLGRLGPPTALRSGPRVIARRRRRSTLRASPCRPTARIRRERSRPPAGGRPSARSRGRAVPRGRR